MERIGAFVTADVVAFRLKLMTLELNLDGNVLQNLSNEILSQVLLIKRGKEPFKGKWALPGGHREFGEDLMETAIRELREETGIFDPSHDFRLHDVVSAKDRDPRGDYVSVVYTLILDSEAEASPGDDAVEACWFTVEDLKKEDFAFDHYEIIMKAYSSFPESLSNDYIDKLIKSFKFDPATNDVMIYDGNSWVPSTTEVESDDEGDDDELFWDKIKQDEEVIFEVINQYNAEDIEREVEAEEDEVEREEDLPEGIFHGFICPFCGGSGNFTTDYPGCDECDNSGWVTYSPRGYGFVENKKGTEQELNEWAREHYRQGENYDTYEDRSNGGGKNE